YPYLIDYFASKPSLSAGDLVAGAHMAYGWVPTILDLYPNQSGVSLDAGAELLTKAKQNGFLDDSEISALASLVNNSFVGASKLLHFVTPDNFAIWDSRVYFFLHAQRPYASRVNSATNYREYLKTLSDLRRDSRFPGFHTSINRKIGYRVSTLRALELVMFLGGSVKRADNAF
ncbi:MAG: hypothetical protein AAB288_02420, partial [Acidobacteriota bacterium]